MGNILSFSGGKDSTAMLHLMLEHGEAIDAVIYCDMGDWEFPEMADHIAQVERNTGITVTRVYPRYDPTKRAFNYRYKRKEREYVGYGWPNIFRRWCTQMKQSAIDAERRRIGSGPHCIGIAADETHRPHYPDKRYPLDEYGYTEADCLAYCKSLGYSWGGGYTTSMIVCRAGAVPCNHCVTCTTSGDTSRSYGHDSRRWTS